ncbi:ParB/RepB/Spo0J family partition protein [Novosphingobium lentum]|uniref:ParB/RepB/Spo0J family partition protein n=1 Tax=Novosphingobium lentum TaxID=145287 RepID=UPI00082958BB|nr:ParB/RepB/Spo0J family partition protein [Novosphingobium lentum]
MGKFDQRAEEFGMLVGAHESARRVEDLPLEWIIPDPGNPRTQFDEGELAELAASIEARGVLQPIIVRAKDANGKHIIRMGERRYRASLAAGRKTIPAIVSEAGEGADVLADQIVENDQRAGLSAQELALGVERMLAEGKNQADIAKALGRSKQFVSLYATYGEMEPYLREAIDKAPIRVLYDLHRAARKHPVEVRAFVGSFGDRGVTLAEGTKFVASLKAPVAVQDVPARTEAPSAPIEPRPAKGAGRGGRSSTPTQASPVKVMVGSRPARLVLPERVRVVFDDGDEIEVASIDLSFD